jgi:hypothetical protein
MKAIVSHAHTLVAALGSDVPVLGLHIIASFFCTVPGALRVEWRSKKRRVPAGISWMFRLCRTANPRRSQTSSKPTPFAGGAVAILSRLSARDDGIFTVCSLAL